MLPDVFDVAVWSLLNMLIIWMRALLGKLRKSSPMQNTCGKRIQVF